MFIALEEEIGPYIIALGPVLQIDIFYQGSSQKPFSTLSNHESQIA